MAASIGIGRNGDVIWITDTVGIHVSSSAETFSRRNCPSAMTRNVMGIDGEWQLLTTMSRERRQASAWDHGLLTAAHIAGRRQRDRMKSGKQRREVPGDSASREGRHLARRSRHGQPRPTDDAAGSWRR